MSYDRTAPIACRLARSCFLACWYAPVLRAYEAGVLWTMAPGRALLAHLWQHVWLLPAWWRRSSRCWTVVSPSGARSMQGRVRAHAARPSRRRAGVVQVLLRYGAECGRQWVPHRRAPARPPAPTHSTQPPPRASMKASSTCCSSGKPTSE
jgi:hypothetical protein